ncbi:MAG TPA: SUMF1/EgtB/PvdO family nonheme iron enzyme, partial [Prosthecobacter sp.]|nr:SUMF1/EgtB/PvdO family nonheme iron enzyme [Prosthecobacter sp.]
YDDGMAALAPVGKFKPDPRGLFDLAGNVWEWVSENWSDNPAEGVVRGAAYTTMERQELLASFRRKVGVEDRLPDVGFRILLGTSDQTARAEE